MNKNSVFNSRVKLGILLILLSAFVYAIHWVFFRDLHHILIYLVGDIAFVFIEVLMVTLIIHHVLTEREKRVLLNKMNMVIGAFFNEVGTELLGHFNAFDTNPDKISKHLIVNNEWSDEHFKKVRLVLENREYVIDSSAGNLGKLMEYIVAKRKFLLRLLENPNLLEHDSFTEMLWGVFHLADELSHRKNVQNLPKSDYKHLAGDIKRAYKLLMKEWLDHMQHLLKNYPYLFSLAMRTNPFDPDAEVEVQAG